MVDLRVLVGSLSANDVPIVYAFSAVVAVVARKLDCEDFLAGNELLGGIGRREVR